MAKITFTQCARDFDMDIHSHKLYLLPVIDRIREYKLLLVQKPEGNFFTIDELFLLVAQQMKRAGVLSVLQFVSICRDSPPIFIETDDEGDMLGDPHHGFFTQRLELLR